MRIGIDFDNTLVDYDDLFHRAAVEQGLIDGSVAVDKLAVRDHLRGQGREDRWTALQGHVYGAILHRAPAYEGAIDFVRRARDAGHELFVISHKTRYPFLGERHDLHAAAENWIERNLSDGPDRLVLKTHVFFELRKEDKLARIYECRCDAFIDDLPEILLAPEFPTRTLRLLFDPNERHLVAGDIRRFRDWLRRAASGRLCAAP